MTASWKEWSARKVPRSVLPQHLSAMPRSVVGKHASENKVDALPLTPACQYPQSRPNSTSTSKEPVVPEEEDF